MVPLPGAKTSILHGTHPLPMHQPEKKSTSTSGDKSDKARKGLRRDKSIVQDWKDLFAVSGPIFVAHLAEQICHIYMRYTEWK